jgi:hypothetical protein
MDLRGLFLLNYETFVMISFKEMVSKFDLFFLMDGGPVCVFLIALISFLIFINNKRVKRWTKRPVSRRICKHLIIGEYNNIIALSITLYANILYL